MGNLNFLLGRVQYDTESQLTFPLEAQIGLGVGASFVALIVLVIVFIYRYETLALYEVFKKFHNIIQWVWPSMYILGLNKVPVFFILCPVLNPWCYCIREVCCTCWPQPALWFIQSPHLMGIPRDTSSLQNTVWYPVKGGVQ